MAQPNIEVLGVYRLPFTDELFREQFEILYGCPVEETERAEVEQECEEQLKSVVLIELLVSDRDPRFRVSDFGQGDQAPWAEGYFSSSGESRLDVPWPEVPDVEPLRMAFFIHSWEPETPLHSSYGDLVCPAAKPMSERLARLIPFVPVD